MLQRLHHISISKQVSLKDSVIFCRDRRTEEASANLKLSIVLERKSEMKILNGIGERTNMCNKDTEQGWAVTIRLICLLLEQSKASIIFYQFPIHFHILQLVDQAIEPHTVECSLKICVWKCCKFFLRVCPMAFEIESVEGSKRVFFGTLLVLLRWYAVPIWFVLDKSQKLYAM